MKSAKLFIAYGSGTELETPEAVKRYVFGGIEEAGHEVVSIITRFEEFGDVIGELGSLGVNIAVLGGTVGAGNKEGHDGEVMAKRLLQQYPNVYRIGASNCYSNRLAHVPLLWPENEVFGCNKPSMSSRINKIIANLPEQASTI
jgi:hypothetical protein